MAIKKFLDKGLEAVIMTRKRNRKPTHPGYFFKVDVLAANNVSISEAARTLGVSRKHLSAFVNEKVPCSRDLAKRLALATETSIASWLSMQAAVDVWEAEHDDSAHYDAVGKIAFG
ncbi:HigA family addiction module antitoxin [Endozoicomonas sp. Mp262]|uniref:HigA family addiction module antitoxin n=1 Tax=Endozoicomonas sp. Mp262 TaxID=2919499 RepID=UPI0021DA67CC